MKTPDAIFFIGRSGAGKGTQAQLLAERLDFFYWEMGAILRAEIASGSDLGNEMKDLVAKGLFLDDHHMFKVIAAHIHEIPKGKSIIFDGVPRRMSQAPYVIGLLHGMGRTDLLTFFLDVPREDSVVRLLDRKRSDDTEEVINRRLDQFEQETTPVLDFLQEMTKFYRIDGRPPISDVAASINTLLEQ